ncbi:hypothetical protein HYH02_005391 [Chlamydomonas schloesseri]|uniref:GAR domain-containing protein n=1 Tax=Chlamydomonas schloesseri TaxID=2026947 RepID=A0A835WMC2_9CHLO|nr:hypothetical protein HYH02_005391 [Chlamydomonas schloesseri]|eukprot:KAG2449868.1 hypothetical protein HYH02_005391 [Chlamydomonas schloesseri]
MSTTAEAVPAGAKAELGADAARTPSRSLAVAGRGAAPELLEAGNSSLLAASTSREILPFVTVLIDAGETGPLLADSARSGGAFSPCRSHEHEHGGDARGGHADANSDTSCATHALPSDPGRATGSAAAPQPASPAFGFDGAGGSLYGRLLHRLAPLSPALAALAPARWADVDTVVRALAADLDPCSSRGSRRAPGASLCAQRLQPATQHKQQELGDMELDMAAAAPAPRPPAPRPPPPPPPAADLSRQACELQGLAGDLMAVLRQAGDDIRRLRARRPRRPLLLHGLTAVMLPGAASGRVGGDGGAAPGEGRRALSRSCSSRRGGGGGGGGCGGRGSASPVRAPLRRAVSGRTREWGGCHGGAGSGAQAPRREPAAGALLLRASSRGASARWAACGAAQQAPASLPPSRMSLCVTMEVAAQAAALQPPLTTERSLGGPPSPPEPKAQGSGAAPAAPAAQPVGPAVVSSRIPRPQVVIGAAGGKSCGAMSEAAAALAAAAAAAAAVQTHVQSLRDRRRETHGEDPAFVTARLEYERGCRAAQEEEARRRAARLLLGPSAAAAPAAAAGAGAPADRPGQAGRRGLPAPSARVSAPLTGPQPLTSALLASANAAAVVQGPGPAAYLALPEGEREPSVARMPTAAAGGGGGGPGPRPPRAAVMSRCSSSHSLGSEASGMSGVSGVSAAASARSAFSAATSAAAGCGYGHAGHGGRVCAACSRRAAATAAAAVAEGARAGSGIGFGCGGGGGGDAAGGSAWGCEGARAQQRHQERAVDAAVARLRAVFEANQVALGLTKVAAFTYAAAGKRYRLQLLPDGRLAVRRGGGWEELTAALARSPRLAGAAGIAAMASVH